MTISYIRSTSFNGPLSYDLSPPTSPKTSIVSSTSLPAMAGRSPIFSIDEDGTVVPNDTMEAGLSLCRLPLSETEEVVLDEEQESEAGYFSASERRASDTDSMGLGISKRQSPLSQRRSQLIFEQKQMEKRGMSDYGANQGGFTPRMRRRRPDTAPTNQSHSPKTPDSAPALDACNKAFNSPGGGLRELTIGSSAAPASNRASWIRRAREHEAVSDSSHALNSASKCSSPSNNSRRHSSFLGDYQNDQTILVFSNNSFDIPFPRRQRKSEGDKAGSTTSGSPGLCASPLHETVGRLSPRSNASLEAERRRLNDLDTEPEFSTPRSSNEVPSNGTVESSTDEQDIGQTLKQADEDVLSSPVSPTVPILSVSSASKTAGLLAPAAEIWPEESPLSTYSQLLAVSPAYTTIPLPAEGRSAPPTSNSAMRNVAPRHSLDGRMESNEEATKPRTMRAGSADESFRRGSTSSSASGGTTSTYRIRRKPVPRAFDGDGKSVGEDFIFRQGSQSSVSLAQPVLPMSISEAVFAPASPKGVEHTDDAPTPRISQVQHTAHTRTPSGSDFMKKAQEAAKARMEKMRLEKLRKLSMHPPTSAWGKSSRPSKLTRPSTALAVPLYQQSKPFPSRQGTPSEAPKTGAKSKDERPSTTKDAEITPPSTLKSRSVSRVTLKRPATAPSGAGGQFRNVNGRDGASSVVEIEGQQFVLDDLVRQRAEAIEAKLRTAAVPNAVVSPIAQPVLKQLKLVSRGLESNLERKFSSQGRISGGPGTVGWGLEEELVISDRATGGGDKAKDTRMSVDAKTTSKTEEMKRRTVSLKADGALTRNKSKPDAPPAGSYSIHPPSMLQLFEASQCTVLDEFGQKVIFGDLFKKRRTLVCFLRHWWCGFCQQFAMSIKKIDPAPLKAANMDFVIIGQGDWHVIKAYRQVMEVPFPIFADPKRNIYQTLGMTVRTNDANPACARPDYTELGMTKGILVAIKKGLFDMPIRNPGDMKLLGGDFILGPGLQCSFTHRMTTADGHMDIPRILTQAGCDMSLKSPKPPATFAETQARIATLAAGNRGNQVRSFGRKSRKDPKTETAKALAQISAMSATSGSMSQSSTSGSMRPSVWGRFSGGRNRTNRSQLSLPASDMGNERGHDLVSTRDGARSLSVMRKLSYDSRLYESFDLRRQPSFESREPLMDTRNNDSMESSLRPDSRSQTPYNRDSSRTPGPTTKLSPTMEEVKLPTVSVAERSLNYVPRSPTPSSVTTSRTSTPVARADGHECALSMTPPTRSPRPAASLSSFQNQILLKQSKSAVGLGIGSPEQEAKNKAVDMSREGSKMPVPAKPVPVQAKETVEALPEDLPNKATGSGTPGTVTPGRVTPGPRESISSRSSRIREEGVDGEGGTGSFLMDLDVYDSISRQPSGSFYQYEDGSEYEYTWRSSVEVTQDSAKEGEQADSDSDTEPTLVSHKTPASPWTPRLCSPQDSQDSPVAAPSLTTSSSSGSLSESYNVSSCNSTWSRSSAYASPSIGSMFSYSAYRPKHSLTAHLEEEEE